MTYKPLANGIELTAHSVVRGPDGTLFDITPLENEYYRQTMRFIPHPWDEQMFSSMTEKNIFIQCEVLCDSSRIQEEDTSTKRSSLRDRLSRS